MSIEVRNLKNGRVYRVRLRDPEGNQYNRSFPTMKEARKWEASELAAQDAGTWIDANLARATFAEVAEEWLASNPAKRASSLARDRSALRTHINPAIGHRPLGAIRPNELQRVINRWATDQAPRTVRRQFEVVRAVFNWAVNTELIGRSPTAGVKLPARIGVRPPRVATPAELAALATVIGPGYAGMVWLGAVCGMRWGECAGLLAGAFDFDAGTVAIVSQRTRGAGGRMVDGPPKSNAGRRTLSVPAALMQLLAAHLIARGLASLDPDDDRVVVTDPQGRVFVGPEGEPLDYSHFRYRVWGPACRAAGVDGLGFHDLRRTNATQLVVAGVDLKTAQTRLGHSDPRLTLAVYAQAVSEADRAAAERIGAALFDDAGDANPSAKSEDGL